MKYISQIAAASASSVGLAQPGLVAIPILLSCIVFNIAMWYMQLQVFEGPDGKGWVFAMEHLDIKGLTKYQATLGEQLAR